MVAHLTCPSCGKSARRTGAFCSACGARLDERAVEGRGIRASSEGLSLGEGAQLAIGAAEAEQRPCPHCTAVVDASSGTCRFCGGAIVIEKVRARGVVIENGASLVIEGGGSLVIGGNEDDD